MSKTLLDELKLCKIANIPVNLEELDVIHIDGCRKSPQLVVGQFYKIELESYIVNPPPNFDLADTWNNGSIPPEANLLVQVTQLLGKMVNISGTGETTGMFWQGWVPIKSIRTCTFLNS